MTIIINTYKLIIKHYSIFFSKVYGLLISNVKEKFRNNLNKFEIHIGNSLENEGLVNPS